MAIDRNRVSKVAIGLLVALVVVQVAGQLVYEVPAHSLDDPDPVLCEVAAYGNAAGVGFLAGCAAVALGLATLLWSAWRRHWPGALVAAVCLTVTAVGLQHHLSVHLLDCLLYGADLDGVFPVTH